MLRKSILLNLMLCFFLVLVGCEGNQLRSREKGALTGGALGAGLGAIVGNQVGHSGAGIAIGSAIGALSGGIIGNEYDVAEDERREVDRRIEEQDRVIAENRRMIDALRGRGLEVRDTDRGVLVNLPDVLFEFDSARLTPRAREDARYIANVLGDVSHRSLSVEGHTDSIGTFEYNQKLSEQRARSVADALSASGVSRSRIVTRGYGESDPIASNATDEGRRRNRRVEVIIENR